ncbi:hypothetical protein TEK04_00670 [Klenkia sp. LSe6-5]|uniref:Uncharacterized protein n=1 Tax=Klenkia sesuvii TaxID=3103137 RepID=A0ABU8DN55_9ACTN
MPADELVAVDLPSLEVLRGRWAAVAAVTTALGFPAVAHAVGRDTWVWDDGGGNRARLTRRPDGAPSGELVAGAPDWWLPPLRADAGEVSFVLGWDGAVWWRAAGALPGGGVAGLPVDAGQLYGVVDAYLEGVADDQGLGGWRPPWPAVAALALAGPRLTVGGLADVVGPLRADLPAGVVAARRFMA